MSFYDDVANDFARMRTELDELEAMYEHNRHEFDLLKAEHPDDRVPDENEALYYSLRAQFNGLEPTNLLDGTLYYYINKTAYSGMIRYTTNAASGRKSAR